MVLHFRCFVELHIQEEQKQLNIDTIIEYSTYIMIFLSQY